MSDMDLVNQNFLESKEICRILFESVNDAIVIADVETRSIVHVNRNAGNLFGIVREELIGMSVSSFFLKEDLERYTSIFYNNGKKGGHNQKDIFLIANSKKKIPVEVTSNFVELDGKKYILWIVAICKKEQKSPLDLSSMELIKAKEEAEEATKLKDKFVSLVAHDLKSPFTSILGLMKIILEDQNKSLDSDLKDVLEKVVKKGEYYGQHDRDIVEDKSLTDRKYCSSIGVF